MPGKKLSNRVKCLKISEMEVKGQEGDLEVILAKIFFLDIPAQCAEGAKIERDSEHY